MCGRIIVEPRLVDLIAALLIDAADVPPDAAPPKLNIAPTEPVLVVTVDGTLRRLRAMRWGLVPTWWREARPPANTFNARAEGLTDAPTFRPSLADRRCVVVASGFYEWTGDRKDRRPLLIRRSDQRPLLFAGLWSDGGGLGPSATIITTAAAPSVTGVHDRMPAILDDPDVWLTAPVERALTELRPWPGALTLTPVGQAVGNARDKSGSWLAPPAQRSLLDG